MSFFLSRCERTVEFEFLQKSEEISTIEVVVVGELVYVGTEYVMNLMPEFTLIRELPKEEIPKFLKDFNKVDCYEYFFHPGTVDVGDVVFKITYFNGDYQLISINNQARLKNNNYNYMGRYYFDDEQFEELMNKYSQD
jgi:hypothetical protein